MQVCHSGGALHVKNALLASPEAVQQRIIVVAIAPAVIIPRKLCFKSNDYISKQDFVTYLDRSGMQKYGDQLQILKPDSELKWWHWDHDFLSSTFARELERHIDAYISIYGEKN